MQDMGGQNAIEILPVSLLDGHRATVARLRRLAADLRIGLGWHYLLDLAWIIAHLRPPPATVLDAGAGWGVMQWYLCEEGFQVLSVDRASRAALPIRFRSRYRVRGLRAGDLLPVPQATIRQLSADGNALRSIARQARDLVDAARIRRSRTPGGVIVYNQDLRDLKDIPDASVDTIVAVSALEHNSPEVLSEVVRELLRVLRPAGRLLATLGAARDEDWFHGPSQGWCYSEASLRRIFGIDPAVPSNFDQHDALLRELRGSADLRDNLAAFYFKSANNGMPWGVWDPTYQPVGVMITKGHRLAEMR
jgi:SAM-dependent methyltransferase